MRSLGAHMQLAEVDRRRKVTLLEETPQMLFYVLFLISFLNSLLSSLLIENVTCIIATQNGDKPT